MSCICQVCTKSFDYDLSVPDNIWELIKPKGKPEGAGLLCPECIVAALLSLTLGLRGEGADCPVCGNDSWDKAPAVGRYTCLRCTATFNFDEEGKPIPTSIASAPVWKWRKEWTGIVMETLSAMRKERDVLVDYVWGNGCDVCPAKSDFCDWQTARNQDGELAYYEFKPLEGGRNERNCKITILKWVRAKLSDRAREEEDERDDDGDRDEEEALIWGVE